jgi:fructose-1,6-bisphosphatase/inositol monophosphatase family enzyme
MATTLSVPGIVALLSDDHRIESPNPEPEQERCMANNQAPVNPEERDAIRRKLRASAYGALAVGSFLMIAGIYDAVSTSERTMFWMILTGIPILLVGGRMLQLSQQAGPGRDSP